MGLLRKRLGGNLKDQPAATALRITNLSGEMLFINNLNQKLEIQPGEKTGFWIFGDGRQALVATVPRRRQLLDMNSLADDTEISLKVRQSFCLKGKQRNLYRTYIARS